MDKLQSIVEDCFMAASDLKNLVNSSQGRVTAGSTLARLEARAETLRGKTHDLITSIYDAVEMER